MSSSSRKTYDTDSIALRRIFAYDVSNNSPFSTGFVLTSLTRGSASFVSPNLTLSTIGVPNLPATLSTLTGELFSTAIEVGFAYTSSAVFFLPSTVIGLGTSGYVSTSALGPYLASTTQNLGSLGYVSTSGLNRQIASTIDGLGTFAYLSSGVVTVPIQSTIIGLGTIGYVSSTQLTSSITGLGTVGFVSSSQIASTLIGLGSVGFVSSTQVASTVIGLGTVGFVSSTQLASTVIGLGTVNYISSSQLVSTVASLAALGYISSSQLASTVTGLASSRYVSSTQLTSSLVGLGTIGYLSTSRIFRSTYGNLATGNWSNVTYLFSSISTNTLSLSTIQFDLGILRNQIIPSTTKLDIELKQNVQFGYYDGTSRNYEFNSFLVRGSTFTTSNIIGQESLQYYILNANAINLSFFFQEKTRFLVTNPLVLSTLRNDSQFSTLTLHHTFGTIIPTTNQFFASPASSVCATVVLDNTV
jgi:hypothetical protein